MSKKIPIEDKKPIDLTEERRKRCAPVVKKVLEEFLSHDLLLSDKIYVEQQLKSSLEIAFKNIIIDHFNDVFDILYQSLEMTLKQAQDELWKKDSDDISFKDIDKVFAGKGKKDLQK